MTDMSSMLEAFDITTHAARLSKTSLKPWILYGPLMQALKTSCQAKAVKFHPLHVTVHGVEYDLEMWVNDGETDPETGKTDDHTPNMPAMTMLAIQGMSKNELQSVTEAVEQGESIYGLTKIVKGKLVPVAGPAILTGAGGTNFPEDAGLGCVFAALLGHDH